jgi:hypothetical protein
MIDDLHVLRDVHAVMALAVVNLAVTIGILLFLVLERKK